MQTAPENTATVQSLRTAGHKVRVTHSRLVEAVAADGKNSLALVNQSAFNNRSLFLTKGGETRVEITFKDGVETRGVAFCSRQDTFSRKAGLKLALERAMNGY